MTNLAENRKAYNQYAILERFQGGLVLQGQEVKSIKQGNMQLKGGYVVFRGNELWLVGTYIPPYQPKNAPPEYQAERARKVLLQKKELRYLTGKVKEKGLTLVPLRIYTVKGGRLKLEFALAKGRTQADKRELLKKRESEREIRRTFSRFS